MSFCSYGEDLGPSSRLRHLDVTLCFQDVISGGVLHGVFLLAAIARGGSVLNAALMVTALAWTLSLAGHFTSTCLQSLMAAVSFLVCAYLHYLENGRSKHPSDLLCLYYLANVLTLAWRMRTQSGLGLFTSTPVASFYVASLVLCFALMISEALSRQTLLTGDPFESPEMRTHIFSRLTYWWSWPVISLGRHKFLENSDLFNLQFKHTAFGSHERLAVNMERIGERTPRGKRSKYLLLRALGATYGGPFSLVVVLLVIVQFMNACMPLLVNKLIDFVIQYTQDPGSTSISDGILIAFGFLFVSMCSSMLYNKAFHICFLHDMVIRGALMNLVYRKSLNISAFNRDSTGSIVNHMQVDASSVSHLFFDIPNTGIVPFQVIGFLAMLYAQVGVSAIISFAIVLLVAFAVAYFAKQAYKYQETRLEYMDSRIKTVSEVLKGMKTVKLYGWGTFFRNRVAGFRDKELGALKKVNALTSIQAAFSTLVPSLLAFSTFALYTAISSETLTPSKVFSSLSVLRLLTNPLNALIWSFGPIVQGIAGYRRIATFLEHTEVDLSGVERGTIPLVGDSSARPDSPARHIALQQMPPHQTASGDTLVAPGDVDLSVNRRVMLRIEDGSFSYDADAKTPVLKNINFDVYEHTLVAVIGAVGAGKSSLISALLGEMFKVNGRVMSNGRVAYVPQQPWILNATVRENIQFGLPFDEVKYARVVDACSLRPDFSMLANGDNTMIGEKGINLSGGQKARISCARALYSDADIFLFDDPLSAVDAHVDRHMFNHMLGPNSMLKHKTRVLVTHAVHHLSEVDDIVVLKDGQIAERGPYAVLMAENTLLAKVVADYNAKRRNDTEDDTLEDSSGIERDLTEKQAVDQILSSDRVPGKLVRRPTAKSNKSRRASVDDEIDTTAVPLVSAGVVTKTDADDTVDEPDDEFAEKMERGSVSASVYMTYFRYCGLKSLFVELLMLASVIGLLQGTSYWLGIWSSDSNAGPRTWYYLGVYAGLMVFNSLLTGVAFYFFFAWIAIRASRSTSQGLLQNIIRLPMSFFDVTPGGRIMNRFSKDQDAVDTLLASTIHPYVFGLLQVLSILISIAIATPWFLLFVVPLAYLFWIIQRLFLSTSRELQRLNSVGRSPVYQQFSETIEGLTSVRAYQQAARFTSLIEDKIDVSNKPLYNQVAINRWLGVHLQLISSLVLFASAFFAILTPTSNTKLVGVSIISAQDMSWMLIMIVRLFCDLETNCVSVERIKEYSELPTEAAEETALALPDSWPSAGRVRFADYSTAYREGLELVLHHLNVESGSGEKIGIVGRTGAGKSSLTLALFRIIEAREGQITIDNVDIAQIGLQALRTRLTILPQDPMVFEGSIRENLDPLGRHTDKELWSSLEGAHLKSYVSDLEGGLDAYLQSSNALSVGQSQLLCLARAILRKTKVLILDEATASVDHQTDELVQQTIRREFADCTIFTIAHRIGTVIDYDKIMVLEKGRLVEFDTPERLLQTPSSHFYALAKESNLVM
ncbi:hypothetical protein RI367_001191 [Sorochytrium milnesiophthora]